MTINRTQRFYTHIDAKSWMNDKYRVVKYVSGRITIVTMIKKALLLKSTITKIYRSLYIYTTNARALPYIYVTPIRSSNRSKNSQNSSILTTHFDSLTRLDSVTHLKFAIEYS